VATLYVQGERLKKGEDVMRDRGEQQKIGGGKKVLCGREKQQVDII